MRGALLLVALFGCEEKNGALLVSVTSMLEIPGETDRIVVRVLAGANAIDERGYSIGAPPRDAWPLVQQINRGEESPEDVTVAVELRKTIQDGTLLLVGYEAEEATIPKSGFEAIDIEVERACDDGDGDEFGIGSGCKGFDCNDSDDQQPQPTMCRAETDGGVEDGGTELCGEVRCNGDEVCVRPDRCLLGCSERQECGDPFYCNIEVGACLCNAVPCDNDDRCRPGQCRYGCCVGL